MTDRKIEHRAQSAGEALDPAGTGEGSAWSADAIMTVDHLQRTVERMQQNGYAVWIPAINEAIALIRAQASALAEARLREAPLIDQIRAKLADPEFVADLKRKVFKDTLTEPQHGNG